LHPKQTHKRMKGPYEAPAHSGPALWPVTTIEPELDEEYADERLQKVTAGVGGYKDVSVSRPKCEALQVVRKLDMRVEAQRKKPSSKGE